MYQPQRTTILPLLLAITCSIFAGSVANAQGLPVEVEEVTTIPAIMLPKEELNEKRVAVLSDIIGRVPDEKQRTQLRLERAKEYLRAQQWSKAAADFQAAAETYPDDSMHWMRAALLFRLAKDVKAYEELTSKMLKHFQETTNPYHAERTAKMCWLPTSPLDERELTEHLADFAVDRRARAWGEYYPATRALGHYRYGDYDKALEALALSDRMNNALREPHSDLAATNHVLRAMCLLKQEKRDEGIKQLQAATALVQKNVAHADLLYADRWNDWLLASELHQEARSLLQDMPE
jgi:tetratricopeptide (TPR) repeat protein